MKFVSRAAALSAAISILSAISHFFGGDGFTDGKDQQQNAISENSVLSVMEKVANWQLANPSGLDAKGWEQGTWYQGAMALARVSDNGSYYYDAMHRIAQDNDWTLGPRIYMADDHNVGQLYLEQFIQAGPDASTRRMYQNLRDRFEFILANPSNASLDFTTPNCTDRWSWADALFMSPPAWVRLAHVDTLDQSDRYVNFMAQEWLDTAAYLYDEQQHFFYRDSTFFNKTEANGKSVFWSRGNGWVLAGLARVLEYLPDNHESRPKFVEIFQQLADAAVSVQPKDGAWRTSLLDPDSFPIPEASGTGLLTFGILWGVNNGLLDSAKYLPPAINAWHSLESFVECDGKLTHVQPVGAYPDSFNVTNTEPYGVGAFLLAGEQLYLSLQ